MMHQFTETAIIHAQQRHAMRLSPDAAGVAAVDQILDRERLEGDSQDRPSLGLCYGSWLGDFAVQTFGAQWIGMHEPEPPRLRVAGVVCSPIDAVSRRLESEAAAPIASRISELQHWAESARARDAARARNRQAWDRLALEPQFANFAALHAECPTREAAEAAIDPWLRTTPLAGRKLLCLAAGGGTHSLLHAAAGASVTVVDISEQALAIDRRIADLHGLPITTLASSMDDLSQLPDASFDVVLQPVSACYLPDLAGVYSEVARVLRDGGQYVVQHKQPASLQSIDDEEAGQYRIVHPAFAGTPVARSGSGNHQHLEAGTVEFVHPLESLLGELCRSGFVIEDLQEPPRADAWAEIGSRQHRACYLPPYIKVKARRLQR